MDFTSKYFVYTKPDQSTFSFKKLCTKVMLVIFFGYPIFMFMVLRLFLSVDTMISTGQLICNEGRDVLDRVAYEISYDASSSNMNEKPVGKART